MFGFPLANHLGLYGTRPCSGTSGYRIRRVVGWWRAPQCVGVISGDDDWVARVSCRLAFDLVAIVVEGVEQRGNLTEQLEVLV